MMIIAVVCNKFEFVIEESTVNCRDWYKLFANWEIFCVQSEINIVSTIGS